MPFLRNLLNCRDLGVVGRIALLFCLLAVASGSTSIAAESKSLSVAYCEDCVPFQYRDEKGAPAGLIIDYWRLWARKTGISVNFMAAAWDESLVKVRDGAADAHAGLFFSEARNRFLDYASALRTTDTHTFFHRSVSATSSYDALTAYRIGVISGDFVEAFLKKRLPDGTIAGYGDYQQLIDDLKRGRLRVFAADTPTALFHLKKAGMLDEFSFLSDNPLYRNNWLAAVRQGDEETLDIVNKGFAAITDAERRDIGRRWSNATKKSTDDSLIIAIDRSYAPLTFMNTQGQPAGFLVDLWRRWAKKAGRQIRFRASSWSETLEGLKSGEVDIHSGLSYSPERANWIEFSDQIYETASRLYHLEGVKLPPDISAYGDRKIGVWFGTYQEAMIRKEYPKARMQAFSTTKAMIDALLAGAVDAIMLEEQALDARLRDMGLQGQIIARPERYFVSSIHAGTRKGKNELVGIINQGLGGISRANLAADESKWIVEANKRFYGRRMTDADIGITLAERAWLNAHPVIRLGSDRAWAPYELIDEAGVLRGLSAEFINRIEDILGITFQPPASMPWSEVVGRAQGGKLDLLTSVAATPERQAFLAFSRPYYSWPNVIAIASGADVPTGLADLAGKRVGVVSGYAIQETLARNHPDIQLIAHDDIRDGLLALSTGKIDAFVDAPGTIRHFAKKLLLDNITFAAPTPHLLEISFGVRKDWPELVTILEKALGAIPENERQQLANAAGVSTEVKFKKLVAADTVSQQEVLQIAAFVLAIVALILTLNWIVRRFTKRKFDDLYRSQEMKSRGLVIVAASLAIVVLGTWFAVQRVEQQTRKEVENSLNTVLHATHETLRVWLEGNVRHINGIASDLRLKIWAEKMLEIPRTREDILFDPRLRGLRAFFDGQRKKTNDIGFFLIAPDRINIGSMRDSNVGEISLIERQRPDLLTRVFAGETVLIPPIRSDVSIGKAKDAPTMFLAAPVLAVETGDVIAALTLRLDVSADLMRALRLGRLGNSGETYAIDQQGTLLSESRFDQELRDLGLVAKDQKAILNLRVGNPRGNLLEGHALSENLADLPLTRAAAGIAQGDRKTDAKGQTLNHGDSDTQGYRDYRGVRVLGAWLWDPVLGIGLITEINEDEALGAYQNIRNTIIALLATTMVLAIGLVGFTLWVGRSANAALRQARDQLEERVELRTRELANSENRIRSIIENAVDGIIVIGPTGLIQSFSPAAERIFGYAAEEVLGNNVKALMPDPPAGDHDQYLERYLETGQAEIVGSNREVMGLRKDGTEFPMDLAIGEAILGEDRIFTGIVRDITTRKEAEEAIATSERRTRLILECVGEGVFGVDTEGQVAFVNPRALEMLGFEENDLKGHKIHAIIHHAYPDGRDYPVEDCPMWSAYTNGTVARIDDEVLWRKDGTAFPVEYNATPILRDDELMGAVISFNDITERKAAERIISNAMGLINESIQYASRIQRSVLPDVSSLDRAFDDHLVIWSPKDVVGGDIYLHRECDRGHLLILIDCTGHGVPGAFMTMIATGAFDQALLESPDGDPAALLTRTNQLVKTVLSQDGSEGESDDGFECGVCRVDDATGEITYAGARFELWSLDGDEIKVTKGDRVGIGYRRTEMAQVFTNHVIPFTAGTAFYMTSDGLVDQIGGDRRRAFGKRRLKGIIVDYSRMKMAVQATQILRAFEEYQHSEARRDDISLVGFKPKS